MDRTQTDFENLVNLLLDDDHGINELAYSALLVVAAKVDKDLPARIGQRADAVDGRFFFKDGYVL